MELEIVRKINGLAGKHPGADRFMKLTTRYGHLAFVLYGLWLWFGGSERDRAARRQAAATAFFGVCACSLLSFCIGKVWARPRPFARDGRIRNFTGHKANAAFPSNHTMNSAVVAAVMMRAKMPGRYLLAGLSALLGASRVFAGIHYPTDLLGGAAIALLTERTILRAAPVKRCAAFLAAAWGAAERVLRLAGRLRSLR